MLAGIGVAATGALVARRALAAPSEDVACKKACNADAKAGRQACAGLKSKEKNACLKAVQAERAACRDLCGVDEPPV
jgi:hypothetical protein